MGGRGGQGEAGGARHACQEQVIECAIGLTGCTPALLVRKNAVIEACPDAGLDGAGDIDATVFDTYHKDLLQPCMHRVHALGRWWRVDACDRTEITLPAVMNAWVQTTMCAAQNRQVSHPSIHEAGREVHQGKPFTDCLI
jgi:hypothetical protein